MTENTGLDFESQLPQPEPAPEEKSYLGDLALAIPRGVAHAAQDTLGLVDTVTGGNLGISAQQPWLGTAHTLPGELVEGLADFATGFIPVAGWLGKVGKVGKVLDLTYSAERALQAAGETGKAAALVAGRGLTAGAIAQFAVFNGHSSRLSNIIQQFPALQNPINEYLAAKQDDPELLGRLKGTIEGLGLGALAEGVLLGLRRFKVEAQVAAEPGATQEKIQAAGEEAVPAKDIETALKPADDLAKTVTLYRGEYSGNPANVPDWVQQGLKESGSLDARGRWFTDDPKIAEWYRNEAGDAGVVKTVQVPADQAEQFRVSNQGQDIKRFSKDPANEFFLPRDLADQAAVEKPRVSEQTPGTAKDFDNVLDTFGLKQEDITKLRAIRDARNVMTKENDLSNAATEGATDLNINRPRTMSKAELMSAQLKSTNMNLTRYSGDEGAAILIRSMEILREDAWKAETPGAQANLLTKRTLEEQAKSGLDIVAGYAQTDAATVLRGVQQRMKLDVSGALDDLEKNVGLLRQANDNVQAARDVMDLFGQELARKLPKAGTPLTNAQRLETAKDVDTFQRIVKLVRGGQAEQGRGLGGNRIRTPNLRGLFEVMSDPKGQQAAVDAVGADNLDKMVDAIRTAYGDGGQLGTAALAKLALGTKTQRFVGFLTSYWMNALLWGPKTWVVNSMSAGILAHYLPFERMIGSAIHAIPDAITGNAAGMAAHRETIADAWAELTGLVSGVPDAFRVAKAVMRDGQQVLEQHSNFVEAGAKPEAMSAAGLPFDIALDGTAARGIDYVSRAFTFPTRFLAAADNFAKHLVYRSSAQSQIARQVMKDATIAPEQWADEIVNRMDKILYNGQAFSADQVYRRGVDLAKSQGATNLSDIDAFAQNYLKANYDTSVDPLKEVALNAMNRAQEATLTSPLTPGGYADDFNKFVQRHPMMRLVTPFVRLPINVLKFSGQRVDVLGAGRATAAVLAGKQFPSLAAGLENSKNRMILDLMSGDPTKAGDALGRLTTGAALTAWGTYLASTGTITGRGPNSPEARKALELTGWQQYSIHTPNGYVSYNRLEPLSTLVSTMADMWDYLRFSHADDQETVESAGFGLAIALAQNFTNKSYLTGISNFVDMVESPDRKMEKFFQGYARSAVPNILGQGAGVLDDNTRDIRSWMDAMMARIPGLSQTLPPMRNVLGEPIIAPKSAGGSTVGLLNMVVPIAYSETNDGVVENAIAEVGHGFSPPKRTINGIDLTQFKTASGQDAYDRFGQLHGEVNIGGQTLRQALRRLVTSVDYQRLSPLSTNELESPKITKINTVIQDYRRKAFQTLLRENPELYNAERAYIQRKTQLKAGNDTRFFN